MIPANRARSLLLEALASTLWLVILLGTAGSASTAELRVAPGISYDILVDGLDGPRGLLFAPNGTLLTVEQRGGRVVSLDGAGRRSVLASGLADPHDLAMDDAGRLYVAETGANRIARITDDGKVEAYLLDLGAPVDLDFAPDGELLICELSPGRLTGFRGQYTRRVLLSNLKPHGLAFDSAGGVYVNDLSGGRILQLTPNGRVRVVADDISVPIGIAVGPSGDLYVAQRRVGRLLRIELSGTTMVLAEGLRSPRDPAFDAVGNLYVAETDTERILKFTGDF